MTEPNALPRRFKTQRKHPAKEPPFPCPPAGSLWKTTKRPARTAASAGPNSPPASGNPAGLTRRSQRPWPEPDGAQPARRGCSSLTSERGGAAPPARLPPAASPGPARAGGPAAAASPAQEPRPRKASPGARPPPPSRTCRAGPCGRHRPAPGEMALEAGGPWRRHRSPRPSSAGAGPGSAAVTSWERPRPAPPGQGQLHETLPAAALAGNGAGPLL